MVSGKAIGFQIPHPSPLPAGEREGVRGTIRKEVREEKKAESSRQTAAKRMIGLNLKANSNCIFCRIGKEGTL